METDLCFNNTYIIYKLEIPNINISNKACHCRNTVYSADDTLADQ
jgi:hypothetical protein